MHERDGEKWFTSTEDIDEFEEDVVWTGAPGSSGSGFGKFLEILDSFIPSTWPGKSILTDRTEAVQKTKVRHIRDAWPVMREERVGWIADSGVDTLDEYSSAIEGQSREEITNVLRAGLGDDAGEVETGGFREWLKSDMSRDDE